MIDLLEDERYRYDDRGAHLLEGYTEDLGRRDLTQHDDMGTRSHREEEVDHAAVDVCHREEAQQGLLSADDASLDAESEVPCEVITREHDPLAEARRTGGVVQYEKLFIRGVVVADILGAHTCGILRLVVSLGIGELLYSFGRAVEDMPLLEVQDRGY